MTQPNPWGAQPGSSHENPYAQQYGTQQYGIQPYPQQYENQQYGGQPYQHPLQSPADPPTTDPRRKLVVSLSLNAGLLVLFAVLLVLTDRLFYVIPILAVIGVVRAITTYNRTKKEAAALPQPLPPSQQFGNPYDQQQWAAPSQQYPQQQYPQQTWQNQPPQQWG